MTKGESAAPDGPLSGISARGCVDECETILSLGVLKICVKIDSWTVGMEGYEDP